MRAVVQTNEAYLRQVRLLLTVLPHVAARPVFALKGGTAINFFRRNNPRLSVDIDLHYLPNNERNVALQDIHENIREICTSVRSALPGSQNTISPKNYSAVIKHNGVQIKLEPNIVIRGTLLPPVTRDLCTNLSERFATAPSIQCVDDTELFAGKLCAALQRQHPRDLFDVLLLLRKDGGLTRGLMDAFIVYLISQGKPIAEILAPNVQSIDELYHNQFVGMTLKDVGLDELKLVQKRLPTLVRGELRERDKQFLIEFKSGKPDWSQIRHSHAEQLPAVRWKQLNLEQMTDEKREMAVSRLRTLLEAIPESIKEIRMTGLEETPQRQLAMRIAKQLVSNSLINPECQASVEEQIATGKISPEDWSLLIEIGGGSER